MQNEPKKKEYAPISILERDTPYGKLMGVTVFVKDFIAFAQKHADGEVLRLNIGPRKEPKINEQNEVTVTHNCWLNPWKAPARKPADDDPGF